MSSVATLSSPDPAVFAARGALDGVRRPDALYLLATGIETFADRLDDAQEVDWSALPGVPARWHEQPLVTGLLEGLSVWLAADGAGAEHPRDDEPVWAAGFACWLAAASGARVLVHASAGAGLSGGPTRGTLAALTDHVRFGGANPLVGIGTSELGPLFPDLTALHDEALRAELRELAAARGLRLGEGVGALTVGPGLETPAEREVLSRLGADLVVQGASAPLLAAAHAGLRALALVAVVDDGPGPADVVRLVRASEELAPAVDDLLAAVAPAVRARAVALREELGR